MKNQQALDAFVARKAAIDDLIAKLQTASADHFAVSPDAVHWGHVGSLGYLLNSLSDAATFMQIGVEPDAGGCSAETFAALIA